MHALKYVKCSNTLIIEIWMLLQLSHTNVPWLYGVQYDVKHSGNSHVILSILLGVTNLPLYIVHLK